LFFNSFNFSQNHTKKIEVSTGADRLLNEYIGLIKNKRLGIVTNHTGVISLKGQDIDTHIVDSLYKIEGIKITALFGPEHGIRGDTPAGEKIESGIDPKTKIPIYSLYDANKKPTPEMLKDVDILIFDIQDVGARFYTYISTLFYIIQAGFENNIPVIVLDRPNPINGTSVEGPIRKEDQTSFVGIAPIPIRYGMTIGELAKLYVGEGYIGKFGNSRTGLTIIELKNWERNFYYDDLSLKWINTSPNIPTVNSAIVYPGTCLIEGTNISEGRGTQSPFTTIGAPFIKSEDLIRDLNILGINGVKLEPAEFTPVEITGMVSNPKYKNEICYGINIIVTDRDRFKPVDFGIKLIYSLHKLYPDKFQFRESSFDRLTGDSSIRKKIIDGVKPDEIIKSWQPELNKFIELRKKYLLY